MRYFQPPANSRFYAGVDLHARALFLVVLDHAGQTRYARNLPAAPEPFRKAIASFRDGLLVACECMHCWYGLADTCRDDNIPFVLGHAWGMKAVHASKSKCIPETRSHGAVGEPKPNGSRDGLTPTTTPSHQGSSDSAGRVRDCPGIQLLGGDAGGVRIFRPRWSQKQVAIRR
jgi:hypothetical protein